MDIAPWIKFWCRVYLRQPYDDTALVTYFEDDVFRRYEVADVDWAEFRGVLMPEATVKTEYGLTRFRFQQGQDGWRIDPYTTYNTAMK